jgi:hypothetical protein
MGWGWVEQLAESTTYSYTNGKVSTITETISGNTKTTNITYLVSGEIDTMVTTYLGKTRTEQYSYSGGILTSITVTIADAA